MSTLPGRQPVSHRPGGGHDPRAPEETAACLVRGASCASGESVPRRAPASPGGPRGPRSRRGGVVTPPRRDIPCVTYLDGRAPPGRGLRPVEGAIRLWLRGQKTVHSALSAAARRTRPVPGTARPVAADAVSTWRP